MASATTAIRVAVAPLAAGLLLLIGPSAEARQLSQFNWKFAQAARTVPAQHVWRTDDLDLFLEHVRHRALSPGYLTREEWYRAFDEGVDGPGESDLGPFHGNDGVAWAAFEKWARKYDRLSCPVFHMCYSG